MQTHWLDLRRRLLKSLLFFTVTFLLCYAFSDSLLHTILTPLLSTLPQQNALVLTRIGTAFFLPIQLAADLALFLTLPYALLEIWRFALPGLYLNERKTGWFFLLGSLTLFILGTLFCFKLILPWLLSFLTHHTPADLKLMLDAGDAIHLMFNMMLIFGLCFQLPLLCVFLVTFNWVSLTQLQQARRYIIVLSFIIGMLLAPPDVLSQTTIALPLCLLFEIGLACVKILKLKAVAFQKENE